MTPEQIYRAACMWRNGRDTREIAFCLKVNESEVYRCLEQIKDEAALLRGVA